MKDKERIKVACRVVGCLVGNLMTARGSCNL
jgi:hypothetical protein